MDKPLITLIVNVTWSAALAFLAAVLLAWRWQRRRRAGPPLQPDPGRGKLAARHPPPQELGQRSETDKAP